MDYGVEQENGVAFCMVLVKLLVEDFFVSVTTSKAVWKNWKQLNYKRN